MFPSGNICDIQATDDKKCPDREKYVGLAHSSTCFSRSGFSFAARQTRRSILPEWTFAARRTAAERTSAPRRRIAVLSTAPGRWSRRGGEGLSTQPVNNNGFCTITAFRRLDLNHAQDPSRNKSVIWSRARQEAVYRLRFLTGAAPRICFWTGSKYVQR